MHQISPVLPLPAQDVAPAVAAPGAWQEGADFHDAVWHLENDFDAFAGSLAAPSLEACLVCGWIGSLADSFPTAAGDACPACVQAFAEGSTDPVRVQAFSEAISNRLVAAS